MNLTAHNKAIIAYLTFVGLIIAFFLNKDEKDGFVTWHIKNMFGLVIILLVSQVTQANIDLYLGEVLHWAAFAMWVFCLIMAIQKKQQGIPGLSEKFQEWFTFLD